MWKLSITVILAITGKPIMIYRYFPTKLSTHDTTLLLKRCDVPFIKFKWKPVVIYNVLTNNLNIKEGLIKDVKSNSNSQTLT